jgi:hypothetical protein
VTSSQNTNGDIQTRFWGYIDEIELRLGESMDVVKKPLTPKIIEVSLQPKRQSACPVRIAVLDGDEWVVTLGRRARWELQQISEDLDRLEGLVSAAIEGRVFETNHLGWARLIVNTGAGVRQTQFIGIWPVSAGWRLIKRKAFAPYM